MSFIPDNENVKLGIVYFEDASSDIGIQGHATKKSINQLIAEIHLAVGRLGGAVLDVQSGRYSDDQYGFQVTFVYGHQKGRIDVACLPIKNETDVRVLGTRKQALYNVVKSLESMYMMRLLSPNADPLLPFLLDPGTGLTLTEILRQQDQIPQLGSPNGKSLLGDGIPTVTPEIVE